MEKNELPAAEPKLTPAMKRYFEIKKENPEYLIFYRMGDFYELFFEDAETASAALDIALTKRGKYNGKPIPMCGVPFHAYESYMGKLVRQGYKVAICEQTETPEEARKRGSNAVIKREVVRLVTAGTLTENSMLNSRKNNFLLCCFQKKDDIGFSWIDMSTAEFYTQYLHTSPSSLSADLQSVFTRLEPTEIIVPDRMLKNPQLFALLNMYHSKLTRLPDSRFNAASAENYLLKHYEMKSLDSFGNFTIWEIAAAGIILEYVLTTQKGLMPRLRELIKFNDMHCLEIDGSTSFNLELTASTSGDKKASLISAIDRTVTGCGARLLAHRLKNPSTDAQEINRRLDIIEFFIEIPEVREHLRDCLRTAADLPRCMSRLSMRKGSPKDLYNVGQTLALIPRIRNILFSYGRYKKLINGMPASLEKLLNSFGDFNYICHRLTEALVEEKDLPALSREGGMIRDGFVSVLDVLRIKRDSGHQTIREFEAKYIKETGISNLRVRYNSVLGYFVEVLTKYATDLIQNKKFIHRQSTLTAVRFTTAELCEEEQKTSNCAEKVLKKELEVYDDLIKEVVILYDDICKAADIFAELDFTSAMAELAVTENYCRPVIDDSKDIEIKGGRHPVVEAALKKSMDDVFIGNDCCLKADSNRVWLLTGPNMAGKSTFLRQNAIIVLMAQMGAYVPCTYARIGIVDKLFSRVGASDDLSRGRSTFMVEMVETASILNQATDRSFVILDEIGRGTATYDGLSIAWAVIEHLHDVNCCRSLFATHYHELTVLGSKLPAMSLHCMRIKEFNDNVIFMHEVIEGTADRSYGVHVAKLAGIPKIVLKRADQVLQSLEKNQAYQKISAIENDLPLFAVFKEQQEKTVEASPLQKALQNLNPDEMSPKEALDKLYEIKKLADEES